MSVSQIVSPISIEDAIRNLFDYDNKPYSIINASMRAILKYKYIFSPHELSRLFNTIINNNPNNTLAYQLAQWGYVFQPDNLIKFGNNADERNWTIAHLMAKRGFIFSVDELEQLKNPVDTRNLSVADVMMFNGHSFSSLEEKQLGIDHENVEYSAYAGFNLPDYFTHRPSPPVTCPKCHHLLLNTARILSDAAFACQMDPFSIDGHSNLFNCTFCNWWCAHESWYEMERGFEGDVLLIGIAKTRLPDQPKNEQPWE
jgi:hypothetical protein